MESKNRTNEQEFYGNVGQVAGGNIINIHAVSEQSDPEVIRLVAELLTLVKSSNLLVPIQNISKIQYGSTHFKALKPWQLKKLLAVAQEIQQLVSPEKAKRTWWEFWKK